MGQAAPRRPGLQETLAHLSGTLISHRLSEIISSQLGDAGLKEMLACKYGRVIQCDKKAAGPPGDPAEGPCDTRVHLSIGRGIPAGGRGCALR